MIITIKNIFIALAVVGVFSCSGNNNSRTSEANQSIGVDLPEIKKNLLSVSLSDSLLIHRGADTIEFGRVREGEIVVKNIEIINSGDNPLVITGVEKTCGCVDIEAPKAPLKPGEKITTQISFDSKGINGWVFKTVSLRTSLGTKPYILVVMADVE